MDTSEKLQVDLQTKILTDDALARSSTKPVYLSSVEVNGGETFSNEFFKKLLSPLVENSDYTFGQLLKSIDTSYSKLVKTDVFKSVNVLLLADYATPAPGSIHNYNLEKAIPTKVVFDLQHINLNTGEGFFTFNSDDHLNVDLNYLNNNFNENAELVNVGVNYNPYKPNEHLIANGRFIANLNNPSFKFLIEAFNTHQNNQHWQQNLEKSTGGIIGLQYTSPYKTLGVLTGLSLSKRTLYEMADEVLTFLKPFGGDHLKSSIVNQVVYNNLKFLNNITKNFPLEGYNWALSNEISSNQEQENPNNQVVFSRTAFSFNHYKSFWNNNFTTHFGLDLGVIYSNQLPEKIHVSDRFYMGGLNSFRGFARNSVNVVGGSQFFKLGLTLYAKLPSLIYSPRPALATNVASQEDGHGFEANPLRLYSQFSVGSIGDKLVKEKLSNGVVSGGVGLKYINHWANFDAGYYVARRINDTTSTYGIRDGFTFSVSIGGSNGVV